ncbi:hypothetical protein [[Mycoplasma] imitans]|uniref:hypothetical protein n=1 Tax=[Mycoplasma] imitans TaxID=29560 RepID=UPI000485E375|nr:hypothetical protein [[Mycoplasma] imitans]
MVSKILNPKIRRIVVIASWVLLIIPLISTYWFTQVPKVLFGLYFACFPISLIISIGHYYLHLKLRKKLNNEYESKGIFEGLKNAKKINIERIKDNFVNKDIIKEIIKSSDGEIQNLDKKFSQQNFYQEYLVKEKENDLRITCLEFCKSKYSLNYPYKYDCYYWVEVNNVLDEPFALLNNKEDQNPGFTKYLINGLKSYQKEKYVLYTKSDGFDLSKVIDDEILDNLLFKKPDTNINVINKNNKTFLLMRMSFNIFNLYYGSDYFDEATYHQLVIQRVENIKLLIDLFYSLRKCIND